MMMMIKMRNKYTLCHTLDIFNQSLINDLTTLQFKKTNFHIPPDGYLRREIK